MDSPDAPQLAAASRTRSSAGLEDIRTKLEDPDTVRYRSTQEVLMEVVGVFDRVRDKSPSLMGLCNRMEQLFLRHWKQAGLKSPPPPPPPAPQPPPPKPTPSTSKKRPAETEPSGSGGGGEAGGQGQGRYKARRVERQEVSDGSRTDVSEDAPTVSTVSTKEGASRQPRPSAPPGGWVVGKAAAVKCPVCLRAKKGRCGTISAPLRCYNRRAANLPYMADSGKVVPEGYTGPTHMVMLSELAEQVDRSEGGGTSREGSPEPSAYSKGDAAREEGLERLLAEERHRKDVATMKSRELAALKMSQAAAEKKLAEAAAALQSRRAAHEKEAAYFSSRLSALRGDLDKAVSASALADDAARTLAEARQKLEAVLKREEETAAQLPASMAPYLQQLQPDTARIVDQDQAAAVISSSHPRPMPNQLMQLAAKVFARPAVK